MHEAIRSNEIFFADLLPEKREKKSKKKDWIKVTALAILAISGLVAAFSTLCLYGTFPSSLMGGTLNALCIALGSALVAGIGGIIFHNRWKNNSSLMT